MVGSVSASEDANPELQHRCIIIHEKERSSTNKNQKKTKSEARRGQFVWTLKKMYLLFRHASLFAAFCLFFFL